ncbi:hypothetical protein BDW59DRAFT_130126 [Aspergillus cavernicola]|uniref:FAD/NAD(P)-binding domain-containing protein n=1 Tax=Aspergillus cavernicola TaxID=176166 RepID=A0ABR4HQY7_9EURO
METVDLIIIGAGWNGLVTAKTALEFDPSLTLLILESSSSVGGVWSKDRLYKGLQTNNVLGSYEYSDFAMIDVIPSLQAGQHIPGEDVHTYLKAYTEHFDLANKIRLNYLVESVEYTPEKSWVVRGIDGSKDLSERPDYEILTPKLILATGLTSQGRIPAFEGQEFFEAPLFHVRDFALHQGSVTNQGTPVTILGGGKSGWDAVYACASTGREVNWVIRESGHGPIWMMPKLVTPFKLLLENLPATRVVSLFSPCVWTDPGDRFSFVRRFLHGTWLGRKLVGVFWGLVERELVQSNRYEEHEETQKLRPWIGPFWVSTVIGVLNYPTDLFGLVRKGTLKIHIADITKLTPNTVHLSNGNTVRSSALVLCTGWKATPNIRFSPEGIEERLGFPWATDPVDQDLVKLARKEIFDKFADLRNPPIQNTQLKPLSTVRDSVTLHPFRLARFIAPVAMWEDRSVTFSGNISTFHTPLVAEVQALWAAVYLYHGLARQETHASILWDTVLHTEFCGLRSPAGYGGRNADFVFDVLPYLDILLRDLGLRPRRKGSLWGNLFHPHGGEDYRGLVGEWKDLHKDIDRIDCDCD